METNREALHGGYLRGRLLCNPSSLQLRPRCGDPEPADLSERPVGFFSRSFTREEPPTVAIVWRSHGTVGPGSLGGGTSMPLSVIDQRLKAFRIFCHGEKPKTMLPQSREHYLHTGPGADTQPRVLLPLIPVVRESELLGRGVRSGDSAIQRAAPTRSGRPAGRPEVRPLIGKAVRQLIIVTHTPAHRM